jgi:hypothetical protein
MEKSLHAVGMGLFAVKMGTCVFQNEKIKCPENRKTFCINLQNKLSKESRDT